MTDLAVWLREQFAEDERVANEAGQACSRWKLVPGDPQGYFAGVVTADRGVRLADGAENVLPHIARWDPARVLAEVAAKRVLLDRWDLYGYPDDLDAGLRILAVPYADRPGYQPEWVPVSASEERA